MIPLYDREYCDELTAVIRRHGGVVEVINRRDAAPRKFGFRT